MPKTSLPSTAAIVIAPAKLLRIVISTNRNSQIRLVLVLAGLVLAELGSTVPSSAQTNTQRAPHPAQVRVHEEPCWQKVGISKDVIDQRQVVEQDTRSQVQAVCADSSLSDPQKKEKIHEIREEAKQKIAGLMTEDQRQELQACQKERAANHPAPARVQHGGGPCGN